MDKIYRSRDFFIRILNNSPEEEMDTEQTQIINNYARENTKKNHL